eukprot:8117878-Alexandrium_andersonii.AAC.1
MASAAQPPPGGDAPLAERRRLDAGSQADARAEGEVIGGEGGAPSSSTPPTGYDGATQPAVMGTAGAGPGPAATLILDEPLPI